MIHMAPGTQRKPHIPYQRLDDVFAYQARQRPHAPAFLAPGRPVLSHRRLRQHLVDMASQLRHMGLERHDRIAVVLPPSAEMAVAFLSVALRATCAPLNPNYSAQEFAFYLERLRATALIVQAGQPTPARTVALAQGLSIIELTPLSQEAAGLFTLSPGSSQDPRLNVSGEAAQPADVALVLHTSGTTSTPKVIPLTHSQICAGAHHTATALGLTSRDCCLNIVPLFHTYGLVATTLASLMVGACVAIPGAFEVDHFFAWIDRFQPTWYPGVPAMHRAILSQSEAYRDVIDRCSLRFIRSAAAPLPQHVLEQLEDVFQVPVIEVYSLSETSLITCNPPLEGPRKVGSVGRPPRAGAASEVSIIDETGTPLPIGHLGEIVVKGPSVITAYDGNADIHRMAFTDGWFHTGDQGYLDQDGYLYLTGRIKDLINRGGEKIAPQEVDNVLMSHAAVAEAATFAVPHTHLIEDIAAAVVLHQNAAATPSELRQFAAERLATFKVPLQIFIVDHIPKLSVSGKLQRHQLAEQLDLSSRPENDAAPRTPIEKALTELWAQVLHIAQVHVDDNFSQLGGDSITATQLLSRIRDVMHVDISFRSFFEEPTVAGVARRLNRSQQIASEAIAFEGVGENQGPLSFAQQRLWFLDQWLPNHSVYNQLHAWRLTGSLNVAALEQSLEAICRRHEILRTTFVSQDGQPVQVVNPVPSPLLVEIDLQVLSEAQQSYDVQQRIQAEVQRRFDLERGPLWFVSLLKLADEAYVLLLNIHHIIIDGWSFEVFFRELHTVYESYAVGKEPELPPLPLQYRDFSLWQRQWFQGDVLKPQLAYWQQKLSKNLPLLALPTDRPRPSIQTFQGHCQSRVLPQRLTSALHTLGRNEGSTLFMTLLAAFNVLLHRYSGQNDLVVGMPIAGRTQLELETLIGFFVNTLILRTDVGGNPPFLELLARVRQTVLEAFDHQDVPFEKLVEALSTHRSTSHAPLFQVIFVLQNASPSDLEVSNLTVERLVVESETAKFDLALAIKDTGQGLHVEAEYATDLFNDATIARMLGHYQTLLEYIVGDPGQCIATLPLLSELERRHFLVAGRGTTPDEVPALCLHQLFQAHAEQTPNAIAVIHEAQYLTYCDLNQQANQLAHDLRHLGVRPEICVGLYIERCLDMIVGILGILKAGGAYVPLDPLHPKDRLSFMIKESGVTVLVTHQRLLGQLPHLEMGVICLDINLERLTTQQVAYDVSPDDVIPNNLAYVMYTSGSTGEPKGVMVEHRQIVGLLYAFEHRAPAQEPRIGCTACAMSFDVAVWEMFSMLCFGGTLHILTHDIVADPERFAGYLTNHCITSAYIPPALLPDVASHFEQAAAMPLQRLLVGVEPIKQQTLQRFRDLSDTLSIVNGYGPTEATICATFFSFDQAIEPSWRTPIGTAIHGGESYLVDAHLQPAPIGIPGELLVGGSGLTRGYINRPELTAARFIPHPFREASGARLYRTGDQARRLSDGTLEFLGRLDQQVKIRGYRIEPGEIEAALTNLPEVEATAVIAHAVRTDDYRLVAYVVPARQLDRMSNCEPEHDAERVAHWQRLFETTYGDASIVQTPTLNLTGWNSSYTGLPIPAVEMREWVDFTVERILSLRPGEVLEIGCGAGLLLSRIAPHCSVYWGTDFSHEALRYVQQLQQLMPALRHVALVHGAADTLETIETQRFDTVILNSVVQYFPSVDYLLHVLDRVMQVVQPGGSIFIGDVRNLTLLEAYHTSVQYDQAVPSLTCQQLRQRVQQGIAQEQELLIAPAFFGALRRRFPGIAHVQILPKRGHYHNELTRFRYDVVLHLGAADALGTEPPWQYWQGDRLTLSEVRRRLVDNEADGIGWRGVPDARIESTLQVLDWLSHAEGTATLDDLRHRLTRYQPVGIDPEELWELGNELSYEVVFSCAHATASSGYDIVFRRRASDALESPMPLWPFRLETDPATPWQCYTNAPRQASATQQLVPYLRQQLRAKLPAYMIPSSFVILDTLPMSPNGKVDRQALSERDILRPPTTAAFVEPRTDPEIALARIWTDVLGLSRVGIHDNFFELGGDSILSIQIVAKANRAGLRLMPRLLFQYQTIAELAAAANVEVKGVPALEAAQQGLITGAVPLTPIQHWFFAQNIAEPQQWNQSRLLAVPPPLDIALLKRAVHQVLSHHDLLRARFRCSPSGWYQDIVRSEPNRVCEDVDLSALPAGQQNMMMQACFEQLQASLDLALGPLVRMVVFDLGPQRYARLFIVVHHLVIDGVSWPILLDDLQTAYDHLHSGREVRLPMKTTSFQYWAARLSLYAQADALRDELPYWAALPQERFRALPRDHAHGDNTVASAHMVSASLSREETYALLHEVPKAYQTQINDALLTALTQVFVRWTGLPALWFDLEGHGREDIFDGVDVSRTVGWFTSLFPVCLQMEPTVDTGEALKGVKEQLRCIPHRGIGYGVLRYLCQHIGAMDNLRTLPQSEINFNYLGRIDQAVSIWFNLIDVPCGHPRNPRSQRPYVLEINSYLTHGRLHLDWTYSQALHQPATIEALAHDFMEALRTLITHCSAPETGGYTPSDFPHLAVNQDELDTLLQSLDASEEGD